MNSLLRNSLYVFSFLPALITIYGNLNGGLLAWSNFTFTLGVLGLLEWVAPRIQSNESSGKNDWFPNLILLLHIPFQWACIGSLIAGIYGGQLSGWALFGAVLSTGLTSGASAIVVAHELIHRKLSLWQLAGKHLLFTAMNPYFFVEHLRVHHKWVGTAKDPATARFNESLYAFVLRSISGQMKGAIQLENQRLKKNTKDFWLLEHYVWRQFIITIGLLLLLAFVISPLAALAFVAQGIAANFLLEYVNYIEHYGLSRDEKTRVTEIHSWDSDKFISRFLLVDLSRHADHHYHASKPYHTLESFESSHKLPSGYAGLFFLAIVPPLWFKIVNPRIPAQAR